ncbi:MAG TPA: MgtC/SapB family protein [Gemmatimonadales bacterium]|nr:MgtC/SapB family protein [Gemmatimonadales bacterium]
MTWAELVQRLQLDLLWSLIMAVLLGGAIGLERELRGKAAGLRTNILICLGATLFTHLSIHISGPTGDPGRIAAQVVTGIGFLGAGTILHTRGAIAGLTSAATIWLVAAIGVAIGTGAIFEAGGATLLTLVVLRGLGALESVLQRQTVTSRLSIVAPRDARAEDIEQIVRSAGVDITETQRDTRGDHLVVHLTVRGPKRLQNEARLAVLRASGSYTLTVED